MSRSGYSEDCEYLNLYRSNVTRALQGERGQAFLRELILALDALSEKALISGDLINDQGIPCAIGAVCKSRSLDVSHIDYTDPASVAGAIGVAYSMAAEIAFMNDEYCDIETDEERWLRMRQWATENLIAQTPSR